ncbi:hypothetical protein ACOMHN_046014 [Nucella lapillus]
MHRKERETGAKMAAIRSTRQALMTILHSFPREFQFRGSYGRTNVPYLDVSLSIDPDGHLTSDLHVKPTDAAMILPFNSCHPRHCPRSIPYSQCLRLRRICSEDSVFEKRCQELKVKLQRRGYPGSLIDAAMRKVSDQPRASTLQKCNQALFSFLPQESLIQGEIMPARVAGPDTNVNK